MMEEFLSEMVEVDGSSLPDQSPDDENVSGYVATACNYVSTFASSGMHMFTHLLTQT
jgi:hypothetical protein